MTATHPIVDRLDTRAIERREVVRTFVTHAVVLEATATHLVLQTNAHASDHLTVVPAEGDSRRFGGAPAVGEVPAAGTTFAGRIRIDLVSDRALRVRYAEGEDLPAGDTPMLIGPVPTWAAPEPPVVDAGSVTYRLGAHDVVISLHPFTLTVRDAQGREVCAIGGFEKDGYGQWDTWNTGICRTVPDAHPVAVECFTLRPGEAVYGFGEQFLGGIDKVGQTIDLNMVEALGVMTPRSYKNIPFFVTTSGYGVYLNHSCRITAWVGSLNAADLQLALEEPFLDYVVMLGSVAEVLDQYTDLTGKSQVPPAWSFGYWQSKISYSSADETLAVARRLRAVGVPVDVIHLDTFWYHRDWFCDLTFDGDRFPDPAAYLAELDTMGIKVCLWQLPYIPEPSRLFDDLVAVDGFVTTATGELYDVGICYTPEWDGGRVGCIDFTSPAAVAVYQRYLRALFALGVAAIKVDFGEQAPVDGIYHDGTPGHRVHNLYPLLYNRAVAEVTAEATGEHIMWARSAWAGSQRYPLHWGGDSTSNWANLGPQFVGGLSFGLSGFPFWSQDIGGFLGFLGPDDAALLIRWMQAGLFASHSRIHGFGDREIDAFGPEVLDVCRDYLQLRYRLLPYLLGAARDAAARSVPVARALVVDFQDDPATWRVSDQWLLGDALLVAPIFDPSGLRRVYLPAGGWTDWWTGERFEGGRWIEVQADLATLPLWQREGSVVALGPDQLHVGSRPTDELVLRIVAFAGADANGETVTTAVVDDVVVRIRYTADGGTHRVEVGPCPATTTVEVWGSDTEIVLAR